MTNCANFDHQPSRRHVVLGILATTGLLLAGCSKDRKEAGGGTEEASATENAAKAGPVSLTAMTVFRDPSCGCCEAWAEIARKAGYQVDLRDDQDMAAVKRRLGVPEKLASCHTAEVGGMVIEGHVPFDDVARLLREWPTNIRGIAVPGMPLGSPGMEVPDGTTQPFKVVAFDQQGKSSVFRG